MEQRPEVCTVAEAAAIARVSKATIRRLIAAEKLRAARVGRSIRVNRRALVQLLTQGGGR